MKYLAILLFAILAFSGCGTAPATSSKSPAATPAQPSAPESQKTSIEPIQQFLIASAATDFHDHGPKGPLRFRNVRVGHLVTDGKESYRLCGEFQPAPEAGKPEWTPFATIKTSGYEQYIGGQAGSHCQGSSFVWDTQDDLSASMQHQLDSQGATNQPKSKNNANK